MTQLTLEKALSKRCGEDGLWRAGVEARSPVLAGIQVAGAGDGGWPGGMVRIVKGDSWDFGFSICVVVRGFSEMGKMGRTGCFGGLRQEPGVSLWTW